MRFRNAHTRANAENEKDFQRSKPQRLGCAEKQRVVVCRQRRFVRQKQCGKKRVEPLDKEKLWGFYLSNRVFDGRRNGGFGHFSTL